MINFEQSEIKTKDWLFDNLLYIIAILNLIHVFNYLYNTISKMYWVKHIYKINHIAVHAVQKKTGHSKINRSLQEKKTPKCALKKNQKNIEMIYFSGNTVWFKKDSN